MNLFFFIVFGLYFLLMILLLVGWQKKPSSHERKLALATITVVVPFRNEANTIIQLIDDLAKLDYPGEYFEVILVNDHSTDSSAEIVTRSISNRSNFRMLSLAVGKHGKKQAITTAVGNATGEIIVTTDADCRIPVQWLYFINDCFGNGHPKMVLGGVRIADDHDFFSQMQALEFSSLVGVSGATSRLGFPTMCNGANLAFLKSAFHEVKGYEGNFNIASGDDEFLMRKIQQRFPQRILFMAAPESVVTTASQKTVGDFVDQRLRWAGKWKYNSSWISRLLAVFVLTFQISFISLLMPTWFKQIDLQWALFLIGLKLILEFVFLFRVGVFLRTKWRMLHFLILQFVYPLYIIFIGVTSLFFSHTWKGRKN